MEWAVVGIRNLRTQSSFLVDLYGGERQRDTSGSESWAAPLEMLG